MSTITEVFRELFYGEGIWLGLLIIIMFVVGLTMKSKFSTVLCLPITLFMGINYLQNGTGNQLWAALIMFITSIFIVVNLMRAG